MVQNSWDGQSYGTPLGYKIFIYALRFLGLRFAYGLLGIVIVYYYIFRSKSRESTIIFKQKYQKWNNAQKKKLGLFFSLKRIYLFGQVMIDRIAVYFSKDPFKLTQSGVDNLEEIISGGGIILSSHFGNWEAGLSMLKSEKNLNSHVAMSLVEGDFLQNILQRQAEQFVSIIPLNNSYDSMVTIKNCLQQDKVVALHGDRYFGDMRTMECSFMGENALFPIGPYIIAATLHKPICFVSVAKTGTKSYELICLPLKTYKWNRKRSKDEQLREWLKEYVDFLEKQVSKYPEQWFNFYDFWQVNKKIT